MLPTCWPGRCAGDLQDRLHGVHGGCLERREQHPELTGAAAVELLDQYGNSLDTRMGDDSTTIVRAIEASAVDGGGLSYEQVDLTGCVLVTVYGSGGGQGAGERDHRARGPLGRRGLPEPDRAVCHSGGDCTVGGS